MVVSVDGLLERLGSRYQFLVFIVLMSCLKHVALNHHLHHHYLATPPHHCKLPDGWEENLSLPTVLIGGSKESGAQRIGYSRCEMYIDPHLHRKGTKPCVHGYLFTLRDSEWSIVAEWGLVCERVWIKHWVMTSYLIGLVIGGLVFGFLSDRFGRRNLLVVSVTTVSCLGLALHFVRRLVVFLSLRFIQAIFVQGIYVTSWTLAGETWPPKWRCRGLVAASMSRPLGVAMGALVAIFVQHWRAVQLAVSLPLLISLLYCWMIPESLRWLLTRGKTRRARLVAGQIAKHNQLVLPPTVHAQLDHLAAHVYQDVPWGSLLTLFKTPRLRKHTFVVGFLWLAISLADSSFRHDLPVFGATGMGVGGAGGSGGYVVGGQGDLGSLLGAGVEAASVVLAAVLTTQLYRRAFLVIHLMLAAALSIAVICVLQLVKDSWVDVQSLATSLKYLGILIVGGARVAVGVVSIEVVPTTARASAIGLCAAHGALGEILSPFIWLVAELSYPSVPWLISAAVCLMAALLSILLPETSGTSLPDVVDEAEVVGLCSQGDVIKACDVGYGRSPYWVEVDGLIVSRSDSEVGQDDDDKFKGLQMNLDSQMVPKEAQRSDKKLGKWAHGAGPSQLIVLPHVHTHRRHHSSCGLSRSTDSLASTCSQCSMMSLVDVSRVNGNNSDTTDSNYSDDHARGRDEQKTRKQKQALTEADTCHFSMTSLEEIEEERIIPQTKEMKHISESILGKNALLTALQRNASSTPTLNSSIAESDMSISMCSLQFKPNLRGKSPMDKEDVTDVEATSSTSDLLPNPKTGRMLLESYMLRNLRSSRGKSKKTSSKANKDNVPDKESSPKFSDTPQSNKKDNFLVRRRGEHSRKSADPNKRQRIKNAKSTNESKKDVCSGEPSSLQSPGISVESLDLGKNLLDNLALSPNSEFMTNDLSLNSSLEYDVSRGGSEIVTHALPHDVIASNADEIETSCRQAESAEKCSPISKDCTQAVHRGETQGADDACPSTSQNKEVNNSKISSPTKPRKWDFIRQLEQESDLPLFRKAIDIEDLDETNL